VGSAISTPRELLDAGFGVATYYYSDIDPDYLAGFSNNIGARYLKPGETATYRRRITYWNLVIHVCF
jgi:hypothetical protein